MSWLSSRLALPAAAFVTVTLLMGHEGPLQAVWRSDRADEVLEQDDDVHRHTRRNWFGSSFEAHCGSAPQKAAASERVR